MELKPDYVGYGSNPPKVQWPNGAKICISFVINYEEGGERNILYGDDGSESYLTEIIGIDSLKNNRNLVTESCFEYGSRVGIYRLLNLFNKYNISTTIYAVGKALELNPNIVELFNKYKHDISSHHYRWGVDYRSMSFRKEKQLLIKTINVHKKFNNNKSFRGMYIGSLTNNTKKILYKYNLTADTDDRIIWHSDCYNDDIPHWDYNACKLYGGDYPLLNIPYSLDTNDFRFLLVNGYTTSNQFYTYLKDAFDCLLEEGGKMMSIGLHGRISGHPGRLIGLKKFIKYILNDKFKGKIWIATRTEIAEFWKLKYPPINVSDLKLKTSKL